MNDLSRRPDADLAVAIAGILRAARPAGGIDCALDTVVVAVADPAAAPRPVAVPRLA